MTQALDILTKGEAHALVVTKLDRLTRSVSDLADLMERAQAEGWALVVIELGIDTTTSGGRLVANVMASVSQWEREAIGERTKAALAVKRAEGHRLGRPVLLAR
jgi:DNA invertase Pin-like site-specific DNA recombinase